VTQRIGVLGWGSLIWRPSNEHGDVAVRPPWHHDGPMLPVEFARISADGRLTLIVLPGCSHLSPVLWARSRLESLPAARSALAARETGAPLERIHGTTRGGLPLGEPDPRVVALVRPWLEERPLDAVIWTGLPPGERWVAGGAEGFSEDGALAYAAGLSGEARRRAAEYVRRAPPQIDTPLRRRLQAVLDVVG
jgi:hypothetical protein